jgi:hypothetical protein
MVLVVRSSLFLCWRSRLTSLLPGAGGGWRMIPVYLPSGYPLLPTCQSADWLFETEGVLFVIILKLWFCLIFVFCAPLGLWKLKILLMHYSEFKSRFLRSNLANAGMLTGLTEPAGNPHLSPPWSLAIATGSILPSTVLQWWWHWWLKARLHSTGPPNHKAERHVFFKSLNLW